MDSTRFSAGGLNAKQLTCNRGIRSARIFREDSDEDIARKLPWIKRLAARRCQPGLASRVTVTNGQTHGQRPILKELKEHIEELKPVMPKMTAKGDLTFFVGDRNNIDGIKAISSRVRIEPSGTRLDIKVDVATLHIVKVPSEYQQDVLKQILRDLYDCHSTNEFGFHELADATRAVRMLASFGLHGSLVSLREQAVSKAWLGQLEEGTVWSVDVSQPNTVVHRPQPQPIAHHQLQQHLQIQPTTQQAEVYEQISHAAQVSGSSGEQMMDCSSPPSSPVPSAAATDAAVAEPYEATKEEFISSFCRESGMNIAWSCNCLAEANWNYISAAQAFLANVGQIPAEAFAVPPQ